LRDYLCSNLVGVFDFGVFSMKRRKREVYYCKSCYRKTTSSGSLAVQIPYESFSRKPTQEVIIEKPTEKLSNKGGSSHQTSLFLVRFLGIFFNCLHFRAGPPGDIMAYMIK
jgi:hypothetical protein